MKKLITFVIAIFVVSACNNPPVEKIVYIPVKDTISDKENIIRIVELEHKLKLTRDSLDFVRDSLGEDLFVAKYKLARIKYYNDIASKGNNIKYLRGWIKRTLNE